MSRVVYVFTHAWLSPLQKGIQAAHAVAELVSNKDNVLTKVWAERHKTLIILNGGNSTNMHSIERECVHGQYHEFAVFKEDDESMESMMTAIAVTVTKYDIDYMDQFRQAGWSFREGGVMEHIFNARLAS